MPLIIKHVGRGGRLAKDLPRDEAREALRALLADDADPVQVGAFLVAMRMKGESAEELAGFADALRETARPVAAPADGTPLVDVDLHGDGRAGRPSLAVAAACLAAAAGGVRVLLRGAFAEGRSRNELGAALAALGLDAARHEAAERALAEAGVAALDLQAYAPRAAALLALRARLGVRTCVNSAVKLMDPAGAGRLLVGIFHGPYHAVTAGAARALGVRRAAVVQAPGGLPEPAPDKPTRVTFVEEGVAAAEPAVIDGAGAPPPEIHGPGELAALNEQVLRAPGAAPPGAVRMVVLQAALIQWAAGIQPADALAAITETLHMGRAALTFDVIRSWYRR